MQKPTLELPQIMQIYGGNIKLLQNAVVNINTANNGTFLIDGKTLSMDPAATNGATVTINGENVFKGNIDTGAKESYS